MCEDVISLRVTLLLFLLLLLLLQLKHPLLLLPLILILVRFKGPYFMCHLLESAVTPRQLGRKHLPNHDAKSVQVHAETNRVPLQHFRALQDTPTFTSFLRSNGNHTQTMCGKHQK